MVDENLFNTVSYNVLQVKSDVVSATLVTFVQTREHRAYKWDLDCPSNWSRYIYFGLNL